MKTNLKYITFILFLIVFISCSEDKITLTGKGTITGKAVTVGDYQPMENVKISTNPVTSVVFTDTEGNFEINDVPINDYSVQAEKDGFLTQFEGITVTEESVINVIFEMDIETANNRPPDAPVLALPENNSTNLEIEVELHWSGYDDDGDDLTYSIEMLNDENSEILEFNNIADTTYTVTGLQYGVKYFWQVAASDNINEPTLSETFTFETSSFPNNRHFYVRKIQGNNVIFSSNGEGNEIQLTSSSTNSWRPRKADNINKIAFLRTNGGQTHIYTMNLDGSDIQQVTSSVPVNGFNLEEIDIAWRASDNRILYSNFDKLYQIEPTGAALQQLYQTPDGSFITEVDWNEQTSKIALKTNDNTGYNVSIYTINISGVVQETILDGVTGAAGGLDFSFDGTKLLYTYDVSGNENPQYRQLNTHIFVYYFSSNTVFDVSEDGKPEGTNDLDARFSPNEAEVIFVNTSNDGISQKNIFTSNIDVIPLREELFQDASMPDWK